MHYRYKKIVTEGANGTTIRHKDLVTLGIINDEIYVYAETLEDQPKELEFIEVTLTQELLDELKKQNYINSQKLNARSKIRSIKDLEDDLTDQKQLIQFMARGFASLWETLPEDIKEANIYKENFDTISSRILTMDVRIDLEKNQFEKISNILTDEEEFAKIVQDEYLGKLK